MIMSQLIKKQKHDCPTEVVCLRAQHTDCSCLWLLSRVLFMILASGFGDTPGNICNTHPGEDDTKNVMWCYKLNNYCPGIWWETLLMLSANILISIQGHAVKNSAYSKDILCTPSWDLFPVMRVKIYYRFTCLYLQLDILSKFEVRIHKLEDTIVPVHRETDDLQRRQASILKKHKTTH